ncbi:hypothetical protein BH11ARM2_BH11ARM2_17920 [soil metagenome]
MDSPNPPIREPARDRFAPRELAFDLSEAARNLLAEPHDGARGHRQVALYKSNHTTLALFAFEAGGRMPEHRARGTVIVQVIAGHLRLTTPDTTHALSAGQVLVLAPDVPHDVVADEPAQMLLTVSMVPS